MKIEKIKTGDQYEEMKTLVENLMASEKSDIEYDQLELATELIEDYEKRHWLNLTVGKEKW